MIAVACGCGKKLKVKDEYAGKRIRCPECSEPVKVPKVEPEESFLVDLDDIEDESEKELPRPRSRSKKSTKKSSAKKKRQSSGSGITGKKIFGVLSMVIGGALLIGLVAFVFSGEFVPKRLGAFAVPIAMISMGWAWVNGETYGE
jgi:hypothetical protein